MSGHGSGGRGNSFWDDRRLKSLRSMRNAKAEPSLMRERFNVSDTTINKGLAILAERDTAAATGERA